MRRLVGIEMVASFMTLFVMSCGSQKSVVKSNVNQESKSETTMVDTSHIDSTARKIDGSQAVIYSSTKDTTVSKVDDSTTVETTTETTYYDTSKLDGNGNPLVSKKEVKKTVSKTYHHADNGTASSSLRQTSRRTSSINELSKSTAQRSVVSNKNELKTKSSTNTANTKSESKQAKYVAMILYGIASVILIGIILYIVVMWYRARDRP